MNKIDSFIGEYRFLSNFYPSFLTLENIRYPTVEHAFQAHKTLDHNNRIRISKIPTSAGAKKAGRLIVLRNDWEEVKLHIMHRLVFLKFLFYNDLREKLLNTGDSELVEGNWWNDTYWGVCNNVGENNLGKILMKVREELRNGKI